MTRALLLAALLAASVAQPALAAPDAAPASVSGQVLETAQASGYTYLRLKTASGEVWAAVPATTVAKGAQVTIAQPMTMQNFESRSLGRTFDKILFGELADPRAKAAPAPSGMPPMSMPPAAGSTMAGKHGAAATASAMVAKVPKAEGPEGRTVAEVVSGKAKLKDRSVAVRGQVVKVTSGILGKNWVHLQDGSGSAADGSNDLLVTTQDQPTVGDIVSARGTVRTDVDLGSGYRYAVLVDGAVLRK